MDSIDMQQPTSQALPGVGAVLVLLLIVRQQPRPSGGVVIEVFMDPVLFLSCYAGLLQHFCRQKSILAPPEVLEDDDIIPEMIPAISIKKIKDEPCDELDRLIARVAAGLDKSAPELCTEGVNGTYFLRDIDGRITAIFKPEDEELSSPNNPKSSSDDSNRGLLAGEAAAREVFASDLNDLFRGFFNVPRTGMVQLTHPVFGNVDGKPVVKTGSLQEFVDNDGTVGDIGPQIFPVDEVQRIALLDLILHNTDRHEGNILYRDPPSGHKQLVPIDHGFSIPDRVGGAWFDWLHYPQAKKEFSPEIKRVVDELDSEILAGKISLRKECRRTLDLSCLLVKIGVQKNMTARDLGLFAARRNPNEISQFEILVEDAEKMPGNFLENAASLMENRLGSPKM